MGRQADFKTVETVSVNDSAFVGVVTNKPRIPSLTVKMSKYSKLIQYYSKLFLKLAADEDRIIYPLFY